MQQQRARLRQAPSPLGIAALVPPGAFLQYQLARLADWTKSQGGPVCGMPGRRARLMAGPLCTVPTLSASLLSSIGLHPSKSTSCWRRVELALMLTPALQGVTRVAKLAF
jgi:hypothetical protein